MSGGELFEKVSDETNRTTEADAANYIRQVTNLTRRTAVTPNPIKVCRALKHMHEMNYVHLDLKVSTVDRAGN